MNNTGVYLAQYTDIDVILDIYHQCNLWLNNIGLHHWDGVYTYNKVYNNILNHNIYVIKLNFQVIGTVTISYLCPKYYNEADNNFWQSPQSEALYISGLAIHPDYMSKGVASSLLKFAEVKAMDENINFIRLDTVSNYNKLHLFYKKRGYIIKGKRYTFDFESYFWEKKMNYSAASGRGIKKPKHKAKMFAPRGGELNPKEIKK